MQYQQVPQYQPLAQGTISVNTDPIQHNNSTRLTNTFGLLFIAIGFILLCIALGYCFHTNAVRHPVVRGLIIAAVVVFLIGIIMLFASCLTTDKKV